VLSPNCADPQGCNQTCAAFINGQPAGGTPEWGQLNFDNWWQGMIFGFLQYTDVYWGQPTGYLMESTGMWSWVFSGALVLIGFLVCYNLTIIIIIDGFEKVHEQRTDEQKVCA
jgi:Ion transport protein